MRRKVERPGFYIGFYARNQQVGLLPPLPPLLPLLRPRRDDGTNGRPLDKLDSTGALITVMASAQPVAVVVVVVVVVLVVVVFSASVSVLVLVLCICRSGSHPNSSGPRSGWGWLLLVATLAPRLID